MKSRFWNEKMSEKAFFPIVEVFEICCSDPHKRTQQGVTCEICAHSMEVGALRGEPLK